MGGNLLSDAALHQVRELIKQESGRARGERTWEKPELHVGPEVFLAYHVSGIAAMSGSTPGSAECNLYEIGSDGTLAALMMDGSTNNKRTVRNASASAVGAGYFPAWRDKLGTWWATAAGSTECAFSPNQPGIPRPTFTSVSTQWPVVNTLVRGSSFVTADTTNNWWNISSAGLWHIWGSVTISLDTADTQSSHGLSYSVNGGSTWSGLDIQYHMHPVAGSTGNRLSTVYFAGANTMVADSKVMITSQTESTAIGWMFESNLHFLRT